MMHFIYKGIHRLGGRILGAVVIFIGMAVSAHAFDLNEIKRQGVLRHLGIPYANFVTGSGDGLDVELIKRFASHLGVDYQFVETSWEHAFSDLTGNQIEVAGDNIRVVGNKEIKGDILANGVTKLGWREKVGDFSSPTFPTQVWLLTRADSHVDPIQPSSHLDSDIQSVKSLFQDKKIIEVMGKPKTCLDPRLYELEKDNVQIKLMNIKLAELVPALIAGESQSTLLDVPDALIALQKWTGKIKIIGPITEVQTMGCVFSKDSPELKKAFNEFFREFKKSGAYRELVEKYYPNVFNYFPNFCQQT